MKKIKRRSIILPPSLNKMIGHLEYVKDKLSYSDLDFLQGVQNRIKSIGYLSVKQKGILFKMFYRYGGKATPHD